MKRIRLFAVAFVSALVSAAAAQAAQVNINNSNNNAAIVPAGQYGDIATTPAPASYGLTSYDSFSGALGTNSVITFAYNDPNTASLGTAGAGYVVVTGSYVNSGNQYAITAVNGAVSATSTAAPFPAVSVLPSSLPVIVSANFSGSTGTETITNLSSSAVNFTSYFLSSISNLSGVTATYNVAAVPLPPAVLLFASGLLALAGFAGYRKSRA